MSGSPNALQELGIVLCLDSAFSTALFWQKVFPAYIAPLIQSLSKMYSAQPPTKLRLGAVVYSRSTVNPPIITNNYFSDIQQGFKEWQENPIAFGLGATTGPGEAGMAVLEGLVAALEMCDQLITETQKPRRPTHPNIPQQPPKKPPVCHIIWIASCAPGGPPHPMHNRNPDLDDLTLDTLPAELAKRNIRLSCIMPGEIPAFVELFRKVGEPPEQPWFKIHPGSVLLLSGFQQPNDPTNTKRNIINLANNTNDAAAKRAKVTASPRVPAKAPGPIGLPTASPVVPKPGSSGTTAASVPPAEAPQPQVNPTPHPNPPNNQQEHQRSQRENALATLNAMRAPSSLSVSAAPPESVGPPIDAPVPEAPQGMNTGTPSVMIKKSNSNSSQTTDVPTSRPQSQPQNMSLQSQQVQLMARGGHSRSQSSNIPPVANLNASSLSGGIHPSPNIQASPNMQSVLQQRVSSQAGSSNGGGSSPSPSFISASPKRGEGVASSGPARSNVQGNPALMARLQSINGQTQPAGDAAQAAEGISQHQNMLLQARMAAQGFMPSVGPANPQVAESSASANAEVWQGTLSVTLPDGKGIPRELTCHVTAKPAGNKQPRQFMLWPPVLRFSIANFRTYQLQEFSQIIKSKTIPLCVFESHPAPAGGNADALRKNELMLQIVLNSLASKQAGAAIYFATPAGPPGTGLFIFAPQPQNKATPASLVGAAFFTQPIPPLPSLADVMNAGNNNSPANMNPHLRAMVAQQQPTRPDPTNAGMFDANQGMQANLLLQHRMAAQSQQIAWMQRMSSQPTQQQLAQQLAQQAQQQQQQQPQQQQQQPQQQQGQFRMSAIGMGGGMVPQHQIAPQAQAQSRLLTAGLGGLGGQSMPMGNAQGGFDGGSGSGSGGMGLGGSFQPQQMGGMNVPGMNFSAGGGMNIGNGMGAMAQNVGQGMNKGMSAANMGMAGLTPEMFGILQRSFASQAGMSGQGNNS